MNKKITGHIAMFSSQLIFGINNPVSKTLMPSVVDGLTLSFLRMAGACVLFWFISLFTPKEHVPTKDILLLAGAALFGIVGNQVSFIIGLSHTTTITASLLVMTTPILTMLGAALVLKEPITHKKVLGVLMGATGAILLVLDTRHSQGENSLLGIGFHLLSCLSFATYLTVFKNLIGRYSSVTLIKWMFLFATIICIPICGKSTLATDFASISLNGYLRLIYVVCFATVLAYTLIPIGQKNIRPTTVSMYNYVQPVVVTVISVILGMGTFGWIEFGATLLVFGGVYVVTQSKSRAQLEAEQALKQAQNEQ